MPDTDATEVVSEETTETSQEELDVTVADSEEETAEEEVTTEEEPSEKEAAEEEVEEKAEEEDVSEEESFEDEHEFLKQYSLPGDPKTLEEAFENNKAMLKEMKRLQTAETGREETYRPQPAPPQPTRYLSTSAMSDTVNKAIASGDINIEDSVDVRKLARVLDSAQQQNLESIQGVTGQLYNALVAVVGKIRKDSWSRFPHKNSAKREELDAVMDRDGLLDYDEAFRELAIRERPDLLKEFANQMKGEGEKRAKKKFKRFSAQRRSKPSHAVGKLHTSYIRNDGSLDKTKLDRLSLDDQERVLESYVKTMEKEGG